MARESKTLRELRDHLERHRQERLELQIEHTRIQARATGLSKQILALERTCDALKFTIGYLEDLP
jgi:transcription initiation factor TFIID subunit TAF12